jgi:hypothetical protein
VDLLYVCNESGSNPEDVILTSQQETSKGRGEMKRKSTKRVLEGSKNKTTKGRKQVTQDM